MRLSAKMPLVRQTQPMQPFDVFLPGQSLLGARGSSSSERKSSKAGNEAAYQKTLYNDMSAIDYQEQLLVSKKSALRGKATKLLADKYGGKLDLLTKKESKLMEELSMVNQGLAQIKKMRIAGEQEGIRVSDAEKKARDSGQTERMMINESGLGAYQNPVTGEIEWRNPTKKYRSKTRAGEQAWRPLTVGEYYRNSMSDLNSSAFASGTYNPRSLHTEIPDNAFFDQASKEFDKVDERYSSDGNLTPEIQKQIVDENFDVFFQTPGSNVEAVNKKAKELAANLSDAAERDLIDEFNRSDYTDYQQFVTDKFATMAANRYGVEKPNLQFKKNEGLGSGPIGNAYSDTSSTLYTTQITKFGVGNIPGLSTGFIEELNEINQAAKRESFDTKEEESQFYRDKLDELLKSDQDYADEFRTKNAWVLSALGYDGDLTRLENPLDAAVNVQVRTIDQNTYWKHAVQAGYGFTEVIDPTGKTVELPAGEEAFIYDPKEQYVGTFIDGEPSYMIKGGMMISSEALEKMMTTAPDGQQISLKEYYDTYAKDEVKKAKPQELLKLDTQLWTNVQKVIKNASIMAEDLGRTYYFVPMGVHDLIQDDKGAARVPNSTSGIKFSYNTRSN